MANQQVESTVEAPAAAAPRAVEVTPALLKTHSITADEYARILLLMGRVPSLTELGIFSVMWSEHCSYKSSRVHLKRLPTKGPRTSGPGSVVQGPGENAGIIDVGDGWACAFKIESHNHPSYIEPYQGAATGVGGILRDIFTMNARPLAVMDSLRFGPLAPEGSTLPVARSPLRPDATTDHVARTTENSIDHARNRATMAGVVAGIAGYGNCFGVPNLGGETRFEACYSGNPLVNAFALGLVRKDEIFYAKATGVGNPVIYVGAKTGRDGIHGATMASEEFTEGSEQKRPNVQMGDPFLEKLLLEACLEAMATGAVLGIQDMGAAGLTCSTCEMGARGELGLTIELDLVPQRETGMSSYEIMLSESQERMLLVADKGREGEVLAVFTKWGLDASIVGVVTADDVMRVTHQGELVAEIPNKALTDDAPVYHRPVGVWKAPVPLDPPAWVLEELRKPRDYTADLKKLLASANICDKRWVFEQYDSMVQTNTVQGPGGEAGVMRIKSGSPLSVDRSTFTVDRSTLSASDEPSSKDNGERAAENAQPSSTNNGERTTHNAQPSATNNGQRTTENAQSSATHNGERTTHNARPSETDNGERTTHNVKPHRGLAMALAGNGRWCYLDPKLGAMHAVAEAARKVACTGATPVAATNCLNFGNPEKPEIMAQLSAAIDGIAEACTALGTPITGGNVSLYNETQGEGIYPTPVIGIVGLMDDVSKAVPSAFRKADHLVFYLDPYSTDWDEDLDRYVYEISFGSSEYAKAVLGETWGKPPGIALEYDRRVNDVLVQLAGERLLQSACDVGSGGLAVAMAKQCIASGLGARIEGESGRISDVFGLFHESTRGVLLTCDCESLDRLKQVVSEAKLGGLSYLGRTTALPLLEIRGGASSAISIFIDEVAGDYAPSLEAQLAAEVVTT